MSSFGAPPPKKVDSKLAAQREELERRRKAVLERKKLIDAGLSGVTSAQAAGGKKSAAAAASEEEEAATPATARHPGAAPKLVAKESSSSSVSSSSRAAATSASRLMAPTASSRAGKDAPKSSVCRTHSFSPRCFPLSQTPALTWQDGQVPAATPSKPGSRVSGGASVRIRGAAQASSGPEPGACPALMTPFRCHARTDFEADGICATG